MVREYRLGVALVGLLVLAACSAGTSQSALVNSSGSTTLGSTTAGTTSVLPTTTTTTTPTTSGLFDTTTANDALPTTSPLSNSTATATESACLSGGLGTLTNGTTTSGSTSELQCLSNSANTNGFGESTLYNAATGSIDAMSSCIQLASTLAPPTGDTQDDVNSRFNLAAAVELRCIRQILQQQMQYPFSQSLLSGMGQSDANLYQMISGVLGSSAH